jgi:hypothetical protein
MKLQIALASALLLAAAPAFAGDCNFANQTGGNLKVAAAGTETAVAAGARVTITEGMFKVKTAQNGEASGSCKAGQNVTAGLKDGKVMVKTE